MEQTVLEAMRAYGMDVDATIERYGGNEDLLLKHIRRFPSDASFTALMQAMETEQREAVKVACHTLKGVSGNLGLTPLFTAACDMMAILRRDDQADLSKPYQAVHAAYDDAIALVHAIANA